MDSARKMRTFLGREVIVYPAAIEVWEDGVKVIAFTPEEWGQMVEHVGIAGLDRGPVLHASAA